MSQTFPTIAVPGSDRRPLPGAVRVNDASPDETVFATVVLRRHGGVETAGVPADESDADKVRTFAAAAGIAVVDVNLAARSVRLRGTAATMARAFGVDLGTYRFDGEGDRDGAGYRGREGAVYVPADLADVVVAILGLDNRPSARAHFRVAGAPSATLPPVGEMAPAARPSGHSPRDIAAAYGFPTGVDGSGETVAIIELGGGFDTKDLDVYFADLGVATPSVEAISVDRATNTPGSDADGEVMLDIEVIGAVAPGAALAVYFGPNTTDGFYDAIAAAVHDTQRQPSVISISWGQAEDAWTPSQMDAYEALFADAAAAGISVYVAAGDNGATDGDSDGALHVDFPASSPSAIGCGGTKLVLDGATISDEMVWNELASGNGATGGGVSSHFATPTYQSDSGVPAAAIDGRGVPDVAGNADPLTGYRVRVDGQNITIGGTSAVAPLWAGLTALANQRNGARAGAPHEVLYRATQAFRDITSGDNGGFSAKSGWDACTGLGSPIGDQIVTAFAG
jgi:kumamolisin